MARYLIEEESEEGDAAASNVIDGLAVAKAFAQKRMQKSERTIVVRDAETRKVLARYEPAAKAEDAPSLAKSVRRMRAANDKLKRALHGARDKKRA